MRRDGVLTGYLWSRSSWGKVKVKGKPTNASKASGRCSHARCRSCHEQPVSKAKSKTKGRNKRARSKLLVDDDDDWAFSSARRANTGRSVSSRNGYLHDADESACRPVANRMRHDTTDDDLDGDDGANDTENVYGNIISDVHAHNCVENVPTQGFSLEGGMQVVMMHLQVMFSDCFANPQAAPVNDEVSDVVHGCHAVKLLAEDAAALEHVGSNANQAALVYSAGDVSDDDDVVHDSSNPSAHAHSHVHDVMIASHISDLGSLNLGCIPDIISGGFACARDFDGSDVNHGGRAVTPRVKDAVFLKYDGSDADHVKMLHAADAVSNDDGIHDDDDHDHDFQSLIPGLVNVDWPETDEREEVSDDINSEGDSLSGDWCHVACSDAGDDWYLC